MEGLTPSKTGKECYEKEEEEEPSFFSEAGGTPLIQVESLSLSLCSKPNGNWPHPLVSDALDFRVVC